MSLHCGKGTRSPSTEYRVPPYTPKGGHGSTPGYRGRSSPPPYTLGSDGEGVCSPGTYSGGVGSDQEDSAYHEPLYYNCESSPTQDSGYSSTLGQGSEYSPSLLQSSGYSPTHLQWSGYSPTHLQGSGYSLTEPHGPGYSSTLLQDAGFYHVQSESKFEVSIE